GRGAVSASGWRRTARKVRPPERRPSADRPLPAGHDPPIARRERVGPGDRAVEVVGGASVVRLQLAAQLRGELRVDVMPVLLGAGLRLLDGLGLERVFRRPELRSPRRSARAATPPDPLRWSAGMA